MNQADGEEDSAFQELATYQTLFDRIERQPLTIEQRIACVSNARNTLVLAGAGTGKTSTLAGRAAYLQASGKARAAQILLLAFAREAADEMDSRIAARQWQNGNSVEARTFHALGLSIVQQVEKSAIALSELSDEDRLQAFLEREFLDLFKRSTRYGHLVLSWFDAYEYRPMLRSHFKDEKNYTAYLAQQVFRSYNDDYARNVTELLFANALAVLGIRYCYRAHYFKDVYIRAYEPYRCCFYLPAYDCYVEIHDVPEHQVSACAAIEKYRARIREIHRANRTCLLEFYEQEIGLVGRNPFIGLIRQTLSLEPLPMKMPERLFRSPSRFRNLLGLLKSALLAARSGATSLQGMRARLENKSDFESRYQALLLDLLMPLARIHEQYILDSGTIDYAMMIDRATCYVREGRYTASWSDILIDEFQDLSAQRYALIKAIRDQNPQIRLFCVGDDWQAIYRFAGSDIGYTAKFESWFGQAKCVALHRTFRFNNQLSALASRFVLENPSQTRKDLLANVYQAEPAVSVLDEKNGLAPVLWDIVLRQGEKTGISVLILARFRHLLLPESTLQRWQQDFSSLSLRCATVHAAKGQEADYVIVLGLNNGQFGFPSGKQANLLQESLLPEAEDFTQAEERRLFYVALTRAREHVYLLYDPAHPSAFALELLNNHYAVNVLANKDLPGEISLKRSRAALNAVLHKIPLFPFAASTGRYRHDKGSVGLLSGPAPDGNGPESIVCKNGLKTALLKLIGFDKRA
ncbi:UvrD-helicase domain-containing protein [Advenella sp. RU8]|uniref:UvrD-helicase domain-containing protein n=1 Tax=Advenella sp. RU8 TaxID=3399575 RepID=UPI003AAD65AE